VCKLPLHELRLEIPSSRFTSLDEHAPNIKKTVNKVNNLDKKSNLNGHTISLIKYQDTE
jgi:hypothetical protein